ncbi:MAG: SdrD B-like domain-containing protein, partial [Saprospiraceae bacterium]|nr:SdrD B-like domain-containing protein [Saprospiraceae bacterium]
MRKTRLQRTVWLLPMLFLAFMVRGQDLSVGVYGSATTSIVGGSLTFKISVRNDGHTALSGVAVKTLVPTGTTYLSHSTGVGIYDNTTGVWTIGAIDAALDSVVLDVVVQVATEGVVFGQAEVSAMVETDGDSAPNNGSVTEDDWSSACATVPIHYNCRDAINVLATAPLAGYTSYQWYKDGVPIVGATQDTYRIKEIGNFNFTASTASTNCPASLCCPISVIRDSCMSLGNLVFDDKDNNGSFDGADVGLDGVEVKLYSVGADGLKGTSDDHLDSTMTTAGGGLFLFTNLNPGLYFVKLTGVGVPTGMVSSTGGGINNLSGTGTFEPSTSTDVDNADNGSQMGAMVMSGVINLTLNGEPTVEDGAANTNLSVDFGLYTPSLQTASVGNLVWNDANNDGIQQNTEGGVPSVKVVAYKFDYTIGDYIAVDSSFTDANGQYSFTNLDSGRYYVKLPVIPTGMSSSTGDGPTDNDGAGAYEPPTSVSVNSDRGLTMGTMIITNPFVLTSGVVDTTVKFGLYVPQSLVCDCPSQQDLVAPVLAGVPLDITVECSSVPAIATATAMDNCTTNPTVTSTEARTNGTCPDSYTLTRTWTATDACGNTATASQIVTVIDLTAPVLANVPVNMTLACEQVVPTAATPTVTDNCDANATVTMAETTPTATTIVRTWTATDACGNTSTASQTMTITPCPKATLGNLVWNDANNDGIQQNTEGGVPSVKVVAYKFDYTIGDYIAVDSSFTDANGQYSFTNLDSGRYYVKLPVIPTGMSSSTGDGPTDNDGAGAYEPPTSVSVNSDRGLTMGTMIITNPFVLTSGVVDTTVKFGLYVPQSLVCDCPSQQDLVAPVLAGVPLDITVECSSVPAIATATAMDNCTTNPTVTSTEARTNGTCPDSYTLTRTWTATDACGNTATASQIVTVIDLTAPVLANVPVNMTLACEQVVPTAATPTVTDNCDANATVTMAETTPTATTIVRTWTATDACGNTSTASQTMTITPCPKATLGNLVWNDANNDGIQQNTEGGVPSVKVVAYKFDYTIGDYIAVDSSFTDANGQYSFTNLDSGRYYVKLPVIPTGMSSSTGDGPTDNDGAGAYEPPTSVSVNSDRGLTMGTMIITNPFVLTSGVVDTTVKFGLYVPQSLVCDCPSQQDLVAPVLAGVPLDITVECSSVPAIATATAMDNCTTNPTVTSTEARTNGTCPDSYTLTRTWTATDACGNTATASQIVTVIDLTAPVLANVPVNMTLACEQVVPTAATPTVTDNCDANATVTMAETTPTATTIVRTWTATDACGNTSTASQTMTITPCPKATLGNLVWNDANNDGIQQNTEGGIPSVKVVAYKFDYTIGDYIAVDSSFTDANGQYSFTNLDSGRYYVKLPVIPTGMSSSTGDGPTDNDGAGAYEPPTSVSVNSDRGLTMGTMIITNPFVLTSGVVDTTVKFGLYVPQSLVCDCPSQQDLVAPVLAGVPLDITVECSSVPAIATATAMDNCTTNPTVTSTEARTNGTCPDSYTLTRTWTATDACGNTATASQIVTVIDLTAPVLANVPVNMTLACEQVVPTAATPTVTDNCDANATVTMAETTPTATTIVRTWTATDACGNTSTASQTMTITPCPKATLGNLVWNDANNDGIQQNTEGGIPSVKVVAYKFDYTIGDYIAVDSSFTDANGQYSFSNLDSGRYYVKLPVIPTGMSSSTGDGPTDNDGAGAYEPPTSVSVNSDRGLTMGTMIITNPFVLTSGVVDTTVKFGLYVPQSLVCDCPSQQDLVAPVLAGVPLDITVECSSVPAIAT